MSGTAGNQKRKRGRPRKRAERGADAPADAPSEQLPLDPAAVPKRVKKSGREPQRERALDMHLEGKTNTEIANALGVTRSCVWKWANTTKWAAEVARRREERRAAANAIVEHAVLTAMQALVKLLPDKDGALPKGVSPWLMMAAIREILERAGWTPPGDPGAEKEEDGVAKMLRALQGRRSDRAPRTKKAPEKEAAGG